MTEVEERQAAAEKLAERDDHPWRAPVFLITGRSDAFDILVEVTLDLQMALTRREKQVAEARELLFRAEPPIGMLDGILEWIKKRHAWLEATK